MKIIDFERKGNIVRLYLGDDSLTNWGGDDWDDYPYQDNAGKVYDQFISSTYDIKFDFDDEVFEPCDSDTFNNYCKFDLIEKTPCLVILKSKYIDKYEIYDYNKVLGDKRSIKIYLGDNVEDVKNKLDKI